MAKAASLDGGILVCVNSWLHASAATTMAPFNAGVGRLFMQAQTTILLSYFQADLTTLMLRALVQLPAVPNFLYRSAAPNPSRGKKSPLFSFTAGW